MNSGGFSDATFIITEATKFQCTGGSSFPGTGFQTFARSLIRNDQFSTKHPPCAGGGGMGCDSYANVYLDGDPDNADFEGGDQGLDSVLEEVTQYVNSLATGYAFNDYYGMWSTSERDGILNFLWYLQRYIYLARTEYPNVHQTIKTDKCWRDAILTIWGRAWLYLEATKNISQLGIDDDKLEGLVKDPTLLNEIQILRDAAGCQ